MAPVGCTSYSQSSGARGTSPSAKTNLGLSLISLMQCSQGWARAGRIKCSGHCALMHQLPVSGKSEKHTFLISLASGEQTGQLVFTDQIWTLKWAGLAR